MSDEQQKRKLKHDLRDILSAQANTAELGAFGKSAYKKAVGTADNPSELAVAADEHMGKIGEWAGFTRELFGALYDPVGMKKLPEGMGSETGAELLNTASTQAAWSELRAASRCHPVVAAEAAKTLSAAVATATGLDQMKDDEETTKSPEELEDELESINDIEVAPDDEQGKKDKEDAIAQINRAINKGRARRKAISEKLGKNGSQIARAVKAAARQAQKAEQAVQALQACGVGAGGGEKDPITPELVKQAMSMEAFAKIVEMVGRMQQSADEKAEEADGLGRLAPCGIKSVKEVTDALPSELAMHQTNPLLFLKRLVDSETVGVERESPELKNKGDIMIFIDRSGSMSGLPIEWAKALGLATIQRAQRDNRRWVVTMYADYNSRLTHASSDQGFQKALETISVNAGGGTSTDWAIRTVVKNSNLTGGLRDPDILLITDGDWEPFSAETLEAMKGLKTRLFVVQLAGVEQKIEGATKVWRISDLNIDKAADIIAEVTL